MATTMVPDAALLPDVLPTERLTAAGRPLPVIREELRRIPDARNATTVLGCYLQAFLPVAGAVALNRWWAYAIAFVLMGRAFALFSILGHEAAHRLLFSRKRINDVIGRWFLAYPAFVPFDLYRRVHMAHHRDELGPNEPDAGLYAGYPISRASFRRKLTRDALGISGWKNAKVIVRALGKRQSRPLALRILAVQAVLAAGLALAGHWWLYPVLWLAPWMTVWRVLNRLRAIAEHGGMQRSDDKRLTTHVVRQRPLARFWIVPYNTGWHLAHHVDSGIPFHQLPALHQELVAAGWVTPAIEHPSYLALWRTLVQPDQRTAATGSHCGSRNGLAPPAR